MCYRNTATGRPQGAARRPPKLAASTAATPAALHQRHQSPGLLLGSAASQACFAVARCAGEYYTGFCERAGPTRSYRRITAGGRVFACVFRGINATASTLVLMKPPPGVYTSL